MKKISSQKFSASPKFLRSVSKDSPPKKVKKYKTSQGLKTALLSSLGSGLEYYDFVVYGMMGPYLAPLFFPNHSSFSSFLQALSIFSLGYLVRPLGGILFGALADHYGRRQAFLTLMGLMAATTLLIGVLPTYEQIGVLAPFCLVLCRIGQGLSFGAELPGAIVMVSETSLEKNQGKGCSWVISSTSIGALVASFILFLLTSTFNQQEILEGLWRLPFLGGGLLAVLFFFLRKSLKETPAFLETSFHKPSALQDSPYIPFLHFLKHHLAEGILGFFFAFFQASLVITNLYFPTYMKETLGYEPELIYKAITLGLGLGVFTIPIFGWLGDQLNRVKFLIAIIMIGMLTAPFFWESLEKREAFSLISFMVWYQTILGAYTGYLPLLARLFPTAVRYTGVAFSYNLAFSLAGFLPAFVTCGIQKTQSPLFLEGALGMIALGTLICLSSLISKKGKSKKKQEISSYEEVFK